MGGVFEVQGLTFRLRKGGLRTTRGKQKRRPRPFPPPFPPLSMARSLFRPPSAPFRVELPRRFPDPRGGGAKSGSLVSGLWEARVPGASSEGATMRLGTTGAFRSRASERPFSTKTQRIRMPVPLTLCSTHKALKCCRRHHHRHRHHGSSTVPPPQWRFPFPAPPPPSPTRPPPPRRRRFGVFSGAVCSAAAGSVDCVPRRIARPSGGARSAGGKRRRARREVARLRRRVSTAAIGKQRVSSPVRTLRRTRIRRRLRRVRRRRGRQGRGCRRLLLRRAGAGTVLVVTGGGATARGLANRGIVSLLLLRPPLLPAAILPPLSSLPRPPRFPPGRWWSWGIRWVLALLFWLRFVSAVCFRISSAGPFPPPAV